MTQTTVQTKTPVNMPCFTPKSTTLSSDKITLQPLSMQHLHAFYQAGSFPQIWRWSLPDKCESLEATKQWLTYSQIMADKGEHVPFAIIDNATNAFVGSTRFCSINRDDKNLEIGFTFITPTFQRTYVNTHAKMLLLSHAFETLGAIRVEFKVHTENEKSRNAVTRLGATLEGIVRNQRILPNGSYRNTALFSIIEEEWPAVKAQLALKMREGNNV